MAMGACPECDADVQFAGEPVLGDRVLCQHCRAALLVIGLTPIELDWAFVEPLRQPGQENKEIRYTQNWEHEV